LNSFPDQRQQSIDSKKSLLAEEIFNLKSFEKKIEEAKTMNDFQFLLEISELEKEISTAQIEDLKKQLSQQRNGIYFHHKFKI
jgi:hypothetical protein